MTRIRALPVITGIGAAVLLACHYQGTPVPMRGPATDVKALAGEWSGEYASAESGRSGCILFTLSADGDTARGDVIMVPAATGPVCAVDNPTGNDNVAPTSEALTISFVAVTGNKVRGRLDPYKDPVCGCTLATTFEGTAKGDRIEGTYRSRHIEGGGLVTGRWWVERRKK